MIGPYKNINRMILLMAHQYVLFVAMQLGNIVIMVEKVVLHAGPFLEGQCKINPTKILLVQRTKIVPSTPNPGKVVDIVDFKGV